MRRLVVVIVALAFAFLGVLGFAASAQAGATRGAVHTGYVAESWTFTIDGGSSTFHPGESITIDGSGAPNGVTIDTVLHSTPIHLGTVTVGADGTFSQTVRIPKSIPLGNHRIIVTASGPGIPTTTEQEAIVITAAAPGARLAITGSTLQPNILTEALSPFVDLAQHPNKIMSAIEIGVVLLLLAVLPAHLLNATIAEQSSRIERRFKRLPKQPGWLARLLGWFKAAPVLGGVIITVVTAVLFGFADPTFGLTLASLRLVIACGVAMFLVGYVADALTAAIARRQWHITVLVSNRPYGLILTVIGVLVSRLLHFSPGFLIGLILGLSIQGKSAKGYAWRTVVTRTCIVLAMAVAAWVGYSTINLGGDEGGTFGTALLVETLVAIVAEGIVALLIELLPLRFLEGERVYAHSRVLWGVLYFVTLVVFVLAVVPWEGNWDALGASLGVWVAVLVAFAVVCIGIYVYFRRFAKPLEEEAGSEEVALGETVSSDNT